MFQLAPDQPYSGGGLEGAGGPLQASSPSTTVKLPSTLPKIGNGCPNGQPWKRKGFYLQRVSWRVGDIRCRCVSAHY